MGKLLNKLIKQNGKQNEMCCPNGSFSCGLFKALGMKQRCNSCKRDAKEKNIQKEASRIIHKIGIGLYVAKDIFNFRKKLGLE